MNQSNKNYLQSKINGGKQKVLLNEKQTGETDELDPMFVMATKQKGQANALPNLFPNKKR